MTSTPKSSLTTNAPYLLLAEGTKADGSDITPYLGTLNDQDKVSNERASVSPTDTHVKHLLDAFAIVVGHLKLTKLNAAGDEKIEIDLDTTGIPNGYVYKANGTGGGAWTAEGVGGTAPIDITVTAGEAISIRDAVYVDVGTMTAYKIDIDANPIRCGAIRGFALAAISNGATGSVRILGAVSGFSGLTPGGDVWASTTAGGYTQTKPSLLTGQQKAVVWLGFASSTGELIALQGTPVQYMKRVSVINDDEVTITHHSDAAWRSRKVSAFVMSNSGSAAETEYDTPNLSSAVGLRTASGSGATVVVDAAGASAVALGSSTNDFRHAQSWIPTTAGFFTQFVVNLGANTGSPTGTLVWSLRPDNAGIPSTTILQTGTFTPVPSTANTVNVPPEVYLSTATTYWLVLDTSVNLSGTNHFSVLTNASGGYASGAFKFDTNNAGTWAGGVAGTDMRVTMTTSASVVRDKIAQSFQFSATRLVAWVQLYMRKVGSPSGTMTLRIETDNAGSPSGTLVDAGATVTVSEASIASGSAFSLIMFDFGALFTLTNATTYWLVLSTNRSASATDYVLWGSDSTSPAYASGEMKADSSGWSALTQDAIFRTAYATDVLEEQCTIGRWLNGTRDIAVRFDDGAGLNASTKTTFKNKTGESLDLTCIVELP